MDPRILKSCQIVYSHISDLFPNHSFLPGKRPKKGKSQFCLTLALLPVIVVFLHLRHHCPPPLLKKYSCDKTTNAFEKPTIFQKGKGQKAKGKSQFCITLALLAIVVHFRHH